MSGSSSSSKRDRFRSLFVKQTKERMPASAASQPSSVPPSESGGVSSIPTTRQWVLHKSNSLRDFLEDVLQKLTADERRIVQTYATSDIHDTIQAAYNAAEKQRIVCESKRWPESDKAQKVVLWLDRFKAVGDVAANADPIHFGLPWAGIRMLLEVAVADIHQMSALVSGMDLALCTANRLRAYFAYFQHLPPALTTDNYRKALVALYACVLQFLAKAIDLYSISGAARRAQASWRGTDIADFGRQCDKLSARAETGANACERDLTMERWADLKRTLQELDTIQYLQGSLDSLQVTVDLSKLVRVPGATFNSMEEDQLPRCLDGTRTELLRQITQWADNQESKCIFWLCGKAGTGKSTISRSVAQAMHERNQLGASFFFKRGQSGRSDASLFFPTIVAQLADKIPAMRPSIAKALDKDSFLCSRGLQDQFDGLLSHPLLSIGSADLPPAGLTIVLDALDECERNMDVRKFLTLLSRIKAISNLRLRIFVTSRPELPIEIGFQMIDGTSHEDVVLEEAQATTIESDLRTYFVDQFMEIKSEWALKRPHDALPAEWPTQTNLEALVGLAVPLFIFASTVCRFVAEKSPTKRLDSILQQQHTVASLRLRDEHSHLRLTYSQILRQVIIRGDDHQIDRNIIIFRELVGPIILLADPLSSAALARLLQVEIEDLDDVLDGLRSVMNVPKNPDDPIRMLHLSFREFLVDHQNTDNLRFRINESQTHARLARQCLRRLAEPGVLHQGMCGVQSPGTERLEVTTQQIRTYISSDVAYACSYWPLHFIQSGEQLCDDSQVYQFLKTHFLHWLEALSWLGSLSRVVAYISDLLVVTKGENARAISAFLEDARRFVLKNRLPINLAPLQVYHSAMIFTPMQSIVRKTFEEHVPKLWAQLPAVPLHWSAEILTLEGHHDQVDAVAFSSDGQTVASASHDSTLRLWNARSGEELHNLKTAISTDGIGFLENDQIVGLGWWGSRGFDMQSWNAYAGEQTQNLRHVPLACAAAALSPNGQLLASSYSSWQICLLESTAGKQTQRLLEGHIAYITELVFSPDSQAMASGSADGTVQVWDTESAVRMYYLREHKDSITDIAFAPNGRIAAAASKDETVLWDARNGRLIRKLRMSGRFGSTVAFSYDGQIVASASDDRTVRSWNVQTGKQVLKIERYELMGHIVTPAMDFSPIEQVAAVSLHDQTFQLWDMQAGKQIKTLEHDSPVNALAFSPSGQIVASAGGKTVWLWNVRTGDRIRRLEHDIGVVLISFSPDGQVIASMPCATVLREDGRRGRHWTVQLWNAQTGVQMKSFQRPGVYYPDLVTLRDLPDSHFALRFLPGGRVSVSEEEEAQIWDAQAGKLVLELKASRVAVTARFLSSENQTAALGIDDGTLRLWHITGDKQLRKLDGHRSSIRAVAISPDDQIVATAHSHGTVQLWNAQTGKQMSSFKWLHRDAQISGWKSALAFSPDSHILAVSDDRAVQLWNTHTGEQMRSLLGNTSRISKMAFSPDGQIIAGVSFDTTIRLWNAQTGEQTQKYPGHTQTILAIAFSLDGQTIASASMDHTVRLWSTQHSDTVQVSGGHEDRVVQVAFSPDAKLVASASWDQTIRLWDPRTGNELPSVLKHDSKLHIMTFSPDGTVIAGSASKAIWLWHSQTGKLMRTLEMSGSGDALSFSPDGTIIAAREPGALRLWSTQTGELTRTLAVYYPFTWPNARVRELAFSPDGSIIAAQTSESVSLWSTQTGELLQKLGLRGERTLSYGCALGFSQDGTSIAAANDHAIWLWNAQTREQTQELKKSDRIMTDLRELRYSSSRIEHMISLMCDLAMDEQTQLTADVDVKTLWSDTIWKPCETVVSTYVLGDAMFPDIQNVLARTRSLELRGQWVWHQGRKLLWLPQEFREDFWEVQRDTLVVGQASGAVSFYRLR